MAIAVLPYAAQAASQQDAAKGQAGVFSDASGNTYGIVGPATPGADESAALSGLIRYENFAEAPAGKQVHSHGKAIRLKAHARSGNCSQTMRGTNQANMLDGSASACDEQIFAYAGDDVVVGGTGNNTLVGGKGADVLTGGGGRDVFAYERAGDSGVGTSDIVTDFTSRDLLDLAGVATTSGVRLSFIGWNSFTGTPGQVNYYIMEYWKCGQNGQCYDGYMTVVQADLTGSGSADFCIDLLGSHEIKAKNLVLQSK